MKIDEIRGKNPDELEFELKKHRKELFDMRFRSATQSLQNPAAIQQLRRTIARIQTIANERTQNIRGGDRRGKAGQK